ncbi:MAG: universal stress protein [Gemmataceae bacterium]
MDPFESILLPTDLLPSSREAAAVAVRLARRFGSRLTLLRVFEPQPDVPVDLREAFQREADPLRGLVGEIAGQGVQVGEAAVAVGPVVDTILHKAQEVGAGLILMGAGDPPPGGRFAVGPVAQAVLEHAPQPVLAVRPGGLPAGPRKVLCAVDHSPASLRALRIAARLTQAVEGDLTVLTVVPAVPWLSAAVETGELADAAAAHDRRWREAFEEALRAVDFGPARWAKEVRHGAPHGGILAAAREGGADVLVMGATGRSGLARVLLGSVTRRVLRDLPCSLLTVKDEGGDPGRLEEDVRATLVLMAQGRGLLEAQSYPAAVAKFRRALLHNPFHIPAMDGLAVALHHLGRASEAEFYRWRAKVLRGYAAD